MKRDQLKSTSIIIPQDAQKRNAPNRGVVVAVGPTCDPVVKVGKVYLHGRHGGDWINSEGRAVTDEEGEFYVLKDEDLIAEVEDVRATD